MGNNVTLHKLIGKKAMGNVCSNESKRWSHKMLTYFGGTVIRTNGPRARVYLASQALLNGGRETPAIWFMILGTRWGDSLPVSVLSEYDSDALYLAITKIYRNLSCKGAQACFTCSLTAFFAFFLKAILMKHKNNYVTKL